jgi:hypothetical protein
MRRLIVSSACLAAAGLVLAGCSSSTGGTVVVTKGASSPTSTSPLLSTSAPSTGFPTTSGSAPAPVSSAAPAPSGSAGGGSLTQSQAEAALLTPAEVGTGFTLGQADSTKEPLPCAPKGSAPLETQVPPQVDADNEYDQGQNVGFEEELLVYSDATTAAKAYTLGVAGFHCTSGVIYNDDGSTTPVTITASQDDTATLGVDGATEWGIKTSTLQGGVFAIQFGSRLLVCTFVAATSVDTSTLPDVATVVEDALKKAQSA